jgi:HEAT repeat protein
MYLYMDGTQASFSAHDPQPEPALMADQRFQPTPDDTALGPGAEAAENGPISIPQSLFQRASANRFRPVFAVAIGVLLAIFALNIGTAQAGWSSFANLFSVRAGQSSSAAQAPLQLDRMKPQKQAEALLELAVGRSDGAVEQISSRVENWQGKVKWDSQIATLTTAALNSSDLRVRESGIEVELAAYGLAKNSASLNYLLTTAESPDPAQKIWALWALGLMANRGVETDRIAQVLTAHLKDSDENSRRWAVEGLALTGAAQAIEPLLKTMHDDPSPTVRERAACALAESGMFTHEQRMTAVPQLLNYTDDPALDAQTHTWAFEALADITRQRLPNDSNAWRSWYDSTKGDSF